MEGQNHTNLPQMCGPKMEGNEFLLSLGWSKWHIPIQVCFRGFILNIIGCICNLVHPCKAPYPLPCPVDNQHSNCNWRTLDSANDEIGGQISNMFNVNQPSPGKFSHPAMMAQSCNLVQPSTLPCPVDNRLGNCNSRTTVSRFLQMMRLVVKYQTCLLESCHRPAILVTCRWWLSRPVIPT